MYVSPRLALMKHIAVHSLAELHVLSDWLAKTLLEDKAENQRGEAVTTLLVLLLHAATHACSGTPSAAPDGR